MTHSISIQKEYGFRTLIVQDGEIVGAVDGSSMVYILVRKDETKPFHWFNNAQPIARWKHGQSKRRKATAWVKAVFGLKSTSEILEALKTTTPIGLSQSLGFASTAF